MTRPSNGPGKGFGRGRPIEPLAAELLPVDYAGPGSGSPATAALDVESLRLPKKYSPVLHTDLVSNIRKGIPRNRSAALAGIHGSTLTKWMRTAQDLVDHEVDNELTQLLLDIEHAEAEYMGELIEEWRDVASQTKQWAGLATLAERQDPSNFAKKTEKQAAVQVNVAVGSFEKVLHQVHEESKELYHGG